MGGIYFFGGDAKISNIFIFLGVLEIPFFFFFFGGGGGHEHS